MDYTPHITGAKELGATQIEIVDNCGGYNMGAHIYEAKMPNGEVIDSISDFGNPLGLRSFKKLKIWI